MAERVLQPAPALAPGLLPAERGTVRLLGAQPGALVLVAPFRAGRDAAEKAVRAVAGTGLTAPGRFADGERGRVHWFAPGQWLIAGEGAETVTGLAERLSGEAAVTDLSDGWVMMALIGAAAREVMARLVPVDVSAEAFPEGRLARTPLGHIPALVTAIPGGFGLTVPRSFADSAVHEITRAMGFVAAREAD